MRSLISRRSVSQILIGVLGCGVLAGLSGDAIALGNATLNQNFRAMEMGLEQDFESYFGEDLADVTQTPQDVAETLERLATQSGSRSGVIWVIPRETELHLVLLLPSGKPIVKDLTEVHRDRLLEMVRVFQQEMSNPSFSPQQSKAAKILYDWMIAPFEAEHLKHAQLDSLLFCLGNGLRGLPIAALQDGNSQYLIEKYSVTSIPAFNLIDTRYRPVQTGHILAAGASRFAAMSPLPAVPFELEMIQSELRDTTVSTQQWQGRSLLNQTFTLKNLKSELSTTPFNIIHLATHAEFNPGKPKKSFIQFQDKPLRLKHMDRLQWPQDLDLLVLSACQIAVGDPQAELGFAGIALKAQIKSVVGSLWQVSDLGTLALMNEFYHHLPQSPSKAIALQQAQLSLIKGDAHVGQDLLHSQRGQTPLPNAIALGQSSNFSHPYYWAGFTLLSSPW